jgi:hypothetical protein
MLALPTCVRCLLEKQRKMQRDLDRAATLDDTGTFWYYVAMWGSGCPFRSRQISDRAFFD